MNSNEMLIETGDYVSASRFGNKWQFGISWDPCKLFENL